MIELNAWKRPTGNFPNGESWINICDQMEIKSMNHIEVKFESNDDLINLMFLKRYMDEHSYKCSLTINNFPYGRMDRQNKDYAFSLKYIAEFINNLNFEYVCICEPHSDVTPALINKVIVRDIIAGKIDVVMEKISFDNEKDILFFPDSGAQKRYSNINIDCEVACGVKSRNFKTGEIISYDIFGGKAPKRNALIVDDLCCGGRTFIEAAKKIKDVFNTENIYLFVAHCEPAIFKGDILTTDLITEVFTTNSITRSFHEKIKAI